MKLERLVVRLNPKNPDDQRLIHALEERADIYGAKNELLRECLRRGYLKLKNKTEHLSKTRDGEALLDDLAQTFANSQYSYRVIKSYLDADHNVKIKEGRTYVGSPVISAAELPEQSTMTLSSAEVEKENAMKIQQQNAQVIANNTVPAEQIASAEKPRRKVDWTKMRGLAGASGSNGYDI